MTISVLCGTEGRWVTVIATAYCPCELCCGDEADGITANGNMVADYPYNIAASRNVPFGTKIYIPTGHGYLDRSRPRDRYWVTDDRGGRLDTDLAETGITRIDLRYRTHYSAKQFGRKTILVWIEIK